MKFLQDRREIANAVNIAKYPVITVDISQPMDGDSFYADCYSGSRVVLATPTKSYPDAEDWCTVKMFGDQEGNDDKHDRPWQYKRIKLQAGIVGIKSSFGLNDVREMVAWNNAVHVKSGDTVVVFFDRKDCGFLRLMKVDGHFLVDVDE